MINVTTACFQLGLKGVEGFPVASEMACAGADVN